MQHSALRHPASPAPARLWLVALCGLMLLAAPARAAPDGVATTPSHHGLRETLDRFEAEVRAAGWVVFTEIDHAAAATAVGMQLRPRTVVLFGNPRAGTPGMAETPTLALDLPMRVLVWQDDAGAIQVTRSTGTDLAQRLFARHGVVIPPTQQAATEAFLAGLVARAAE